MDLAHQLFDKGFRSVLILDTNIQLEMDDLKEIDWMRRNEILKITPTGIEADLFILKYAKEKKLRILSNNLFKEYQDEFGKEWIEQNCINFTVINGETILD
jgi:hypothetical protein